MSSLVALDIETTGLDPEKDRIIEIGAVRFNSNRVENEWHSLINPGKPLPPFITQLTGITDQMLIKAPPIQNVLQDLQNFIGNTPILGHSVKFDLSFLKKYRIGIYNQNLDTYEIASVLNPTLSRYGLSALAQHYGLILPATHRALDDARVTRALYLELYKEILKLPIQLLAEIVHLTEGVDWGGNAAFQNAMRERTQELIEPGAMLSVFNGQIFTKAVETTEYLQGKDIPQKLESEELSALLNYGGVFSHYFPNYEYRPQQIAMLEAVADAFSNGRHFLIEAGTGTGKSMAYLIPAAYWSLKNNLRVVISTNTINLQEQLINKDIPDLINAADLNLRATVVKGRSNYLCLRKFENFYRRGPQNADEARLLAKLLIWLQFTETGDRAELNLNNPSDRDIWNTLSAEDSGCTAENCLKRMGGRCPFYRVRQAAQSAHLLIVNHALLLADVATGNRVLPEYDYLIIDEGHHLEEAITNALSFELTPYDVERVIQELGSPNFGLLGRVMDMMTQCFSPSDQGSINFLVQEATDLAFRIDTLIRDFFASIDKFFYDLREGEEIGLYSLQERILNAHRSQPNWYNIETSWDELEKVFLNILETLKKIQQAIAEYIECILGIDEDLYTDTTNLINEVNEILENIHALVFQPNPDMIYWIEIKNNHGYICLHAAPLHVGSLVKKYIWNEKTSVVLTSATLTTAKDFQYIRERLQADATEELAVGSPFDYETSTLLYLASDIPEPSDRYAYQREVEKCIINTCIASQGRALVLFTSYDQLRRTSQAISPALSNEDIVIYEQGEGASAHSLLDNFRLAEKAVLLGTRAFWEGVDIPGEALSVLIIAKLPFDVPTDPIISARSETFEDPFYQYSLPEAILKFRQGFGRLIRTKHDRGVVIILDKRIQSKRYGKLFLDSLPTCTTQIGALSAIPRTVQKWLNV